MIASISSPTRLLALCVACCAACADDSGSGGTPPDLSAQLVTLSQRSIYFGHQSVGNNIMDGVRDLLASNAGVEPSVAWTESATDMGTGTWAESGVGSNYDPISKIDEFHTIMDGGAGAVLDIAFMKFCWVDFDDSTYWSTGGSTGALFTHYQTVLSELETSYPDVTFVHFTAPLFIDTARNARREEYNALVRAEYGTAVFDLALLESTRPNGTRELGTYGPALVPAYTNVGDEGHLNTTGRAKVAQALVEFLAALP